MRLCSFEDRKVVNLEPLSLTRPAFDLLCGQTSLVNKQCRYFGASDTGALQFVKCCAEMINNVPSQQ